MGSPTIGPRGGNLLNPERNPEYRTSPLNAAVDEATGLPGLHRFQRQDSTIEGRAKEQAWHRMAAFMLLSGKTNKEIAAAADVHVVTVSQIRAQRWFQELLATLANEQGQDIRGLLAAEAAASVEKLVQLRDNSDSDRVQLAAAKELLEQAHGKAVTKILSVSTTHKAYASESEEMEEIKRELEALQNARKG